VRRELWPELGMSRSDREQNLNRIAVVASLLARNGVIVIVSAIAPYARSRQAARDLHARAGVGFAEVHVATPVDVCRRRDVKGLYARQARGELVGLTGVDGVYERPIAPELRLDTSAEPVGRSAGRLLDLVLRQDVPVEEAVR
jgi:adenylylsulfate kinase